MKFYVMIRRWTKKICYDCSREDIKLSQSGATPSVAAMRDFNGTNRSDTVSHLLKLSHRGYSSSVG